MKLSIKKPVNIPAEKLRPFEGNPFKVRDDEEMNRLTESVKTSGILSPLIVRPIDNTDEYQVISGHRRLHAAVKAEITEVPALVYAVSRDEAAVMLVDSNLGREHILPSEKAFSYKLRMEALCHQGITCGQADRDNVSDIESCATVQRYIRLTNLIPELLEKMDEGKIAFSVGEALSYLGDEEQYAVLEQCEINDCTPSYAQAVEMKKRLRDGNLSDYDIEEIMSREKANQRETIKISKERIDKYIPKNLNAQQTIEFFCKACEHYQKYLKRQRECER